MLAKNERSPVSLLPSKFSYRVLVKEQRRCLWGFSSRLALGDVTRCALRCGYCKHASLIMVVLTWVNVKMGNWGEDSSHEIICSIFSPEIYQKLSVSPQGEEV